MIKTKQDKYWIRLLPIIFFISYLNLTVFLFAFGPWDWPVKDGTKLYVFLVFAHLALLLGYLSAAFGKPKGYYGRFNVERLVLISMCLNLALMIPTSVFRTGSGIPDVVAGLSDLGSVYKSTNEMRSQGGAMVEYIRIIVSPALSLLLPLTFFYWGRIKPIVKFFSVFTLLGFLAIYVATGTNKAIADLVLLVPCIVLARYLAGQAKVKWPRIILLVVICGFMFGLFFSFFAATMTSRLGSKEAVASFSTLNINADLDNFIIRPLPEELKIPAVALINYLTQGYYGLYLSLEKPFVPMFGVGNSVFLYFNAIKLIGIEEIKEMPYPIRTREDGWDGMGQWSTIYPWIASDVSFPGTIIVVFFIGRLFASAWVDSLRGSNPYAVAIFTQLLIMLFYFPANNQVLQTGEALFGFYGLLLFWLFTRGKYVWRTK
jgi:hypothetical protein